MNNRGGWVDYKLDQHWWAADTKPLRVLRAYVLLGTVARMTVIKNESDRVTIARQVGLSVQVASDAFNCAMMQPGRCVFFDERMAELEVNVLRLLSIVISQRDDDDLIRALNTQIVHTYPLLKGVDSVKKLIDVATTSAEFAADLSKLVSALFVVGQEAYFTGRRIGAIYRDSIELQMITLLSSLDTMCAIRTETFVTFDTRTMSYKKRQDIILHKAQLNDVTWAVLNFYGAPSEIPSDACRTFRNGLRLWHRGAGDLNEWNAFLSTEGARFRKWIIPTREPFIQASDLIWRACEHIGSDADEKSECIGRQRKSKTEEPTPFECALDFREQPNRAAKIADATSAGRSDLKDAKLDVHARWCRLILYRDVMELRANRQVQQERASARLYWLSDLTPSPSHPLIWHPPTVRRTLREQGS